MIILIIVLLLLLESVFKLIYFHFSLSIFLQPAGLGTRGRCDGGAIGGAAGHGAGHRGEPANSTRNSALVGISRPRSSEVGPRCD